MKRPIKVLLFVFVFVGFFLLVTGLSGAQADGTYENALSLYKKGHYNSAVALLSEYVKSNPYPAAYYLIGYALYKLRRHEAAVKYFNQVYLIDPDFKLQEMNLKSTKNSSKL